MLFDVSHMGQAEIADAAALEAVVTGDIRGLAPGRQRYTLLMNEAGGIVDDLMVANLGDRFQLVLNASRKDDDVAHLRAHGVNVTPQFDRALLALQGPQAVSLLPEAAGLKFMDAAGVTIEGIPCIVSRSGYTGEDGFEIGCAAAQAEARGGAPAPPRGDAGGAGRARFAAAGGRAVPVRQRDRRRHQPDRSRISPGRSASAARPIGIFSAPPRCARCRRKGLSKNSSGSSSTAAPRPAPARKSTAPTADRSAGSPPAVSPPA